MRRLLLLSVSLLAMTSGVRTQRVPTPAEIAVFRGETPSAEQLAALEPVDRAWLQAAQKPPLERVLAFLALGREHPELGLRVLVQGAHTLEEVRRGRSDSTLAQLEEAIAGPLAQLEGLHAALARDGADAGPLAEARAVLSRIRLVSDREDDLQVRAGARLHVPAPRPSELELRWTRLSGEDALELPPLRIPAGTERFDLRTPDAGLWRLQLREPETDWRSQRRILVSNLAFDALAIGSHVIVAVRLDGEPVGEAELEYRTAGGVLVTEAVSDALGLAQLRLPVEELGERALDGSWLEVRKGAHRAKAQFHAVGRRLRVVDELRAHVFCERPLYRRGEHVRGRILVRQIENEPGGPAVRPCGSEEARLHIWPRTDHPLIVRGRTDRHGVFEFECTIPQDASYGMARADFFVDGNEVWLHPLFRVDPFRRSPIQVSLEAPERLTADGPDRARLSARWSNGAVAAAAPVTIEARLDYESVQRLETRLGADGSLELGLPKDPALLEAGRRIELDISARGPDGQPVHVLRRIEIGPERRLSSTRRGAEPRLLPLAKRSYRPGEELQVIVDGVPFGHALLVLEGKDFVRFAHVQLAHGATMHGFRIPEDAWGRAELTVVQGGSSDCLSVDIARPRDELRIELLTAQRSFLPGAECNLELSVVDAAARPVRATVTMALVDERLLALEDVDDLATTRAFGALYWVSESLHRSAWPRRPKWTAIGELMQDGRPLAWIRGRGPSGPGAGAASSPSWADPMLGMPDEMLRKDFRSSVGFAVLRCDENGRVGQRIQLPDDLTTWRLRVVAIDDGLGQAAARFELKTEKPLSVEVALPRYLRLGDRIRTTPAVSSTGTEAGIEWGSETSEELQLAKGTALARGLELHARSCGTGKLRVAVRQGDMRDGLERMLPVRRDTVREELHTSCAIEAAWRPLSVPEADELDCLVVSAGRNALLAELRQRLQDYPYRCAEQTSSRLLGLFGRTTPRGPEQLLDRDRMLTRLQRLWHPSTRLYSWWPAEVGDREITALVLHGVRELQLAGHPLQQRDLLPAPSDLLVQRLLEALDKAGSDLQAEELALVEHLIALLRLCPEARGMRDALESILGRYSGLPRGLLARAGLALLAANRRERALELAHRLSEPGSSRVAGIALGEEPRVQMSFELRLRQRLGLRGEITEQLERRLVADLEHEGFGHTWSAACVLHALSHDLAPDELPETLLAELRIDGKLQTLRLDAENQYRVTLPLNGQPRVELRSAEGHELHARLLGARHVAAGSFLAKGEGLWVRRTLVGLARGAVIERGKVYELRIEVGSERDARYLVVRSPLPAGCEPQQQPWGVERHDDAVVFAVARLRAGEPGVFRVPVAFGFEGDVLWPPVHVHDMYGHRLFAYSDGDRARVGAPSGQPRDASRVLDVLSPEYRRVRIEAALAAALQSETSVWDACIEAERWCLPLDQDQCERYLRPLFARVKGSSEAGALFTLPGVPGPVREPRTPAEWAHAMSVLDEDLKLREDWLAAPDESVLLHLPSVAWQSRAWFEAAWAAAFRVGYVRNDSGDALPAALEQELHFAERLLTRAEQIRLEDAEDEIEALEDLARPDLFVRYGAAESPRERAIRLRLDALTERARQLRTRWLPEPAPDSGQALEDAIAERRWKELSPEYWTEELDTLDARDIAGFLAHGERGRRYLLEHVKDYTEIEDEELWLATFAQGEQVSFGVLRPLLMDGDDYVRLAAFVDRVPAAELRAWVQKDPDPALRAQLLMRLAALPGEFPLEESADTAGYRLVWNTVRGERDARVQLEERILRVDSDESFDFAYEAWRALAPRLSKRIYEHVIGWMTQEERTEYFVRSTPDERSRLLDEGWGNLPEALPPEIVRELRTRLWARILGDPSGGDELIPHFLRSEAGFRFLERQLLASHSDNGRVASWLLEQYGLLLPFRTNSTGEDPVQLVRGRAQLRKLAKSWLDGELWLPEALLPRTELQSLLRERGCWLAP